MSGTVASVERRRRRPGQRHLELELGQLGRARHRRHRLGSDAVFRLRPPRPPRPAGRRWSRRTSSRSPPTWPPTTSPRSGRACRPRSPRPARPAGLRHGDRRRPGRRGQLVPVPRTFPVTVTVTGPQSEAVRRHLRHGLDHHQAGEQRARRARAGPAHQRLHDVRREARRRQAGAAPPVKLGNTYGASTQITSGLAAGDKVVLTTFRVPTGRHDGPAATAAASAAAGGFGGGAGGGRPAAASAAATAGAVSLIELPGSARPTTPATSQVEALRGVDPRSRRASTSRSSVPAGRASPR